MKNLKIGITLGLKENNESIWTNGIKQNVLMFIDLLKKSQNNYEVCILNTINLDWSTKPYYLTDIDIFNFKDKFMEMDLLIVMGAQVHNDELNKFKEDKNKRVISYKCGSNYILHVEETLFKEDIKNYAQYETQYDEVWYIPQQHETNQGFYSTIYRTNSLVVPFIWNSKYLQIALNDIDNGFKKGSYKKDSKYNPTKEKKVIGVMEPNLNIVKYCLIPTLIAEESYRTETGKNKIQKLMLTNSGKLSVNKNFMSIIKTLDLFKDNKISSEARYQTAYVTTQHMDIVVCHQLLNPLNYLYLDLVYMGYPVLHNAYMCKDIGYYYEGSDTIEGGKMLNWILENHDNNFEEYNQRNRKILEKYHSDNPILIETYDKLIFNLFNGGNKDLSFDVINNKYLDIRYNDVSKIHNDDIVFYVIYSKDERLKFMKKQISKLNLPYKVIYFKGYTPETNKEWIDMDDKNSSHKLQSCFRSHISSIKDFTKKHPNKKYVCVIEDDVCFLNENFESKLLDSLKNFSENKNIDYLSIGYLPTTINNKSFTFKTNFLDNEKLSLVKKKNDVYYEFRNKGFTIWGAQAQIFPMETAKKIVELLDKETAKQVYDSVNDYVVNNPIKQNKLIYLTPDSIIPVMFEQGIVYPPLAIEGEIYSTIHEEFHSKNRISDWKKYEELGNIKLSNYYRE